MDSAVRVRREGITFPTYEPAAPDRNPMFLEKRVYQGSSGRVYPLPFTDRIAETPVDREWNAIFLDNGLVELMLLPEIGGRIHAARDLTNGYDFIYRQNVIKPALVGLAGPWISGGIEFNWPQHHRPSTFMPTEAAIEHGEDGSVTVWMGEHEPMDRTKGMHGVCLHPGRSVVEIKVRLYNRTPYVQTFLWWANIAARVHEGYRSFFPPDAGTVADHAKRALSAYPLADGHYYGVDYGARGRSGVPVAERPAHFVPRNQGGAAGPDYMANDLAWYANIPVPTSYMCMGTREEFFGGYDHFAEAGLLHLADRHVSPGKKQWTWGNHEFGYAWDRNLTDADGPYIELMAGVYTDNQPDFSWIAPGETKTFSQFLYPYQAIGPVHFANLDAAISVEGNRIGVAVTRPIVGRLTAWSAQEIAGEWDVDLHPGRSFLREVPVPTPKGSRENSPGVEDPRLKMPAGSDHAGVAPPIVRVVLTELDCEVIRYEIARDEPAPVPSVATEPPLPAEIESADELFLTGQHLVQYRHATRDPAAYWREALRRDSGDARCNNAMGLWHLRRGEFRLAKASFERAVARLTARNPNPADGEPFYNLGLAQRFLGEDPEASFAKAAWNAAWVSPAQLALAELACGKVRWDRALEHLDRCLRVDADNLRARDLKAIVLRRLERDEEAESLLRATLALDPLDALARWLLDDEVALGNAVRIDLAIDLMRAGLEYEGIRVLDGGDPKATDGTAPMLDYARGYLFELTQRGQNALIERAQGRRTKPDYCFPSRLEEILFLESALAADPGDARAAFYLGNLMYDRRRHEEAIALWERATAGEPGNAIAHRNLGIGLFNVRGDADRARASYHAAVHADPEDARLRYERDQLLKRVGVGPEERLAELSEHMILVNRRDDLTIEFCALLNAVGRIEEAAAILDGRRFQPWEGGEGMALGIFSRTHLALGRAALAQRERGTAREHFERVLHPPESLGEARHPLANASDLWLALGDAFSSGGNEEAARGWWTRAAEFRGDFQEMAVREFSEMTAFQALALRRLGREDEARAMLEALQRHAEALADTEAKIDYFATSLPTMLLFDDGLQIRQENAARFMRAQAAAGLGRRDEAQSLLGEVFRVDPNHAMAVDLRAELSRGQN